MTFTIRPDAEKDMSEMLRLWREMMDFYAQVAHNNPISQAFWRTVGCTDYMEELWYNLETE